VTPLNLEFGEEDKQQHKSSGGPLSSIAGMFCTAQCSHMACTHTAHRSKAQDAFRMRCDCRQ